MKQSRRLNVRCKFSLSKLKVNFPDSIARNIYFYFGDLAYKHCAFGHLVQNHIILPNLSRHFRSIENFISIALSREISLNLWGST